MKHRTFKTHCPKCNATHSAASAVDGGSQRPEPGDWTLCAKCGAILTFDKDLSTRLPTDAEWAAETPATRRVLTQLSSTIEQNVRRTN